MAEETESGCSICRVYALNSDETAAGASSCVQIDDTLNRLTISNPSGAESRVTVDHVFKDSIEVEDVYQDALYPFTEALFQGYSTVVFNFGKDKDRAKFMFNKDNDSDDEGILNMAAEQIFTNVKAASGSGVEFLVHTSMFHVRKDKVLDGLGSSKSFSVKERSGKIPEVRGIKQERVESQDAFDALYERVASERPSDSLRVVNLTVEVNEPDARGNDQFRQGSLIVVDVYVGVVVGVVVVVGGGGGGGGGGAAAAAAAA